MEDEDVQFLWDMLAVDIKEVDHANELLQRLVNKWITIRGFFLTVTWLEEYKKATKKSTKKWKFPKEGIEQCKKKD